MIKLKFNNIIDNKRFTLAKIHKDTGINRNTLTALYYNRTTRVDLNTLDRLLIFFNKHFDCELTDLLEYSDK